MTTFSWLSATTGDWSTAADWTPSGGPPGGASSPPNTDVATLRDLGTSYTVSVTLNETFDINQLNIGGASSATSPTLLIGDNTLGAGGALLLDNLNYTMGSGQKSTSLITLGAPGSLLDIRASISDAGGSPTTISIFALAGGAIGSGGHLEFGSLTVDNPNVTYRFQNSGARSANTGVIEFLSGGTVGAVANQHISFIGNLDEFIVDGANFSGDTVSFKNGTLTVNNGASTVFTMKNLSVQPGFSGSFVATGDEIIAVCYARGSMIRTPDGEQPVEKLRPGRQVITLVDGHPGAQTVKWLGHRRINLANHPRPETVAPIRICHDAVADGVPHRDLVVSPDHAIFIDGKLICARQLVNGTTIRMELDWTAVDYYHVELDQHAILLAEGLPAESYIDTGNAGFFANSGAPLLLRPDLTDESGYPTREAGSCEPFVWDEASVRPVWQRLADRAAVIGRPVPRRATTADPELRLIAKGRTVKPIYGDDSLVIFTLPRNAREVRLVSRAQPPTEARPWLEDRRRLGVRISRIVLRGADEVREVPVDHPDLAAGWWAVERDGQTISRWTDGEALLPLPAMQGHVMLEVHLAGAMTFVAEAALAA